MTRSDIAAIAQGLMFDCLADDLRAAVETLPIGWWWSGGVCNVSCHASCGPDSAFVEDPMLTRFDAGFHADLDQPSTLAKAVRACAEQANTAVRDFLREVG